MTKPNPFPSLPPMPKPPVTVTSSTIPSLPFANMEIDDETKAMVKALPTADTAVFYGETGTYKTTQIALMARYVYEKYGLKTRYIYGDGGSYRHIQKYIDAGIMEVVDMRVASNPLPLIRALMKGAWNPIVLRNGVPMLTPPKTIAVPIEVDGKVVGSQSVTLLQEPIGMYAIEGISSISGRVLRHITREGKQIGEDVVGKFTEPSMWEEGKNETFAASGRSHYGFAQNFVFDMVNGFSALPVHHVIFSAHEGKGEDNTTKVVEYGPGTIGKATIKALPPMVGDLFHLESIEARGGMTLPGQPAANVKPTVRAYFTKHPDSQLSGILWPAKVRFSKDKLEKLYQKWPEGYIDLANEDIVDFYRLRDNVEKEDVNDLLEWKKKLDEERKK